METAEPELVEVDGSILTSAETAEVEAWKNMYAAMPQSFSSSFGADMLQVDGITLTRCKTIPFSHFNAVLDLGVARPVTDRDLQEIATAYRTAGIDHFVIVQTSDPSTAHVRGLLAERGFIVAGQWERIVAPANRVPAIPDSLCEAEVVTAHTAAEWAAFVSNIYRFPTEPWLLQLAQPRAIDASSHASPTPRWSHAMLRRDGRILAARSMYVSESGWAWLGVDAPVPGIMAPTFEEDAIVTRTLMRIGLEQGAIGFLADIEAPHPDRNTPAYGIWRSMGFTWPYMRLLFRIAQ